jgi:hypothetical protein
MRPVQCFNQAFFDPPRRAVAEAWADTGLGLHRIEEKHHAGNVFWRMGHSTLPWTMNATSPWWVSQGTFDYICDVGERIAAHRADEGEPVIRPSRAMRRLMRMKLAVLPTWGQSDMVFRLVLRGRARVFQGRGRFVEDNRDNVHFRALGAFEVEQVFLPGLSWLNTTDPGLVAKASRAPVPGWQDHVEVRGWSASSFFDRGISGTPA